MIALAPITPDWEIYEVWIDGVKQEYCFLADEEEGIAYCERRIAATEEAIAEYMKTARDYGHSLSGVDLELRRGKVEIRFRGGAVITQEQRDMIEGRMIEGRTKG